MLLKSNIDFHFCFDWLLKFWWRISGIKNATNSTSIEIFIFDPAVERAAVVFDGVALDELDADGVGEAALRLGAGDQVLVHEIDLEVLATVRRDQAVRAPRAASQLRPYPVEVYNT